MLKIVVGVGISTGDPGKILVRTSPSWVKVRVLAGKVNVLNDVSVVGIGIVENEVIVVSSPLTRVVMKLMSVSKAVVDSIAVVRSVIRSVVVVGCNSV